MSMKSVLGTSDQMRKSGEGWKLALPAALAMFAFSIQPTSTASPPPSCFSLFKQSPASATCNINGIHEPRKGRCFIHVFCSRKPSLDPPKENSGVWHRDHVSILENCHGTLVTAC